ncbi:class I adenylate cyclase [Desulfobacter postgatei]|uniref:class I adenylate cyclase n=1 Tax=Desulfobacter postgatei TaxID=2293 RepID=UPI00259B094C|nr:class I adenylate cyclase [uncultured Desulfobacter sp.]
MNLAIDNFDYHLFESHWEKLSRQEKVLIVKNAGKLDPEIAILPVLTGLTSYYASVRSHAQKSLEAIQINIGELLADALDKNQYATGIKKSVSLCARIYAAIQADMAFDQLSFFLKTLLGINGKGAYFAFKALCQGLVSIDDMEKLIFTVPEPERLAFVDEYIQSSPGIRLKFGFMFKRILNSIQQRDCVVKFFAGLFDRQRDVDPFLNNINSELRDPEQILSNEIRSQFPETRVIGLKALAMMVTKISPDLLIDILDREESEEHRIVVYNIVEESSVGTYKELADPILRLFYQRSKREALHAFKALVVSGKFAPHRLLKMMRNKYPSLIPLIHSEISDLSKFSFFIIQDIALNQNQYVNLNFGANLACIFGMIKKRPERIVKIFVKYATDDKAVDRRAIKSFIEKTKQILAQEKKSIETEFDPVIQLVHKKTTEMSRASLTLMQNRIEKLKHNENSTTVYLEDQVFTSVNLSSCDFSLTSLFFNKSIIDNSDFSKTSFSNTFFKKTVFHNVDMRQARFKEVNFDHTVFINVNAASAVFTNCSFQHTAMYNCDFSHACLKEAPFIEATISKVSFNLADLSGACFSYSTISAVSFMNAVIDQADFSGTNARFCQFPPKGSVHFRADALNFNARKYQLSVDHLPPMKRSIVAEINMQIFSEFIHYGEEKFLKQNQLSILTAFDLFNKDQTDLFQLIPLLLHENIVLPGMKAIDTQTPCGIWNYMTSPETLEILSKYIDSKEITVGGCPDYAIESLFTIGSVGSIAQESRSDIDYWVCINEDNLSTLDIALLKKKLEILEKMALDEFHTQVTFFIVDVQRAKNNDFGGTTHESSGTAQSNLLKEEFYRTMLHVAGKIPLWAVVPSTICMNYYSGISNSGIICSNTSKYIDLGDVNAISTGEYLGASLWQMFKSLKSPYKSVIKMALLEKYIYAYKGKKLLCNEYKDEWMNSGAQLKLAQNDAYFILLEHLRDYFQAIGDPHSVALLLQCFFLKLGISEQTQIDDTIFGLRKILLEYCIHQWDLTKDDIFKLGRFKDWKYGEIATLSKTINAYMIKTYKKIMDHLAGQDLSRSKLSPEDRTVLGRKVFIEFVKLPHRIEKMRLLPRNDRYYRHLYLQYIKSGNNSGMWQLLNKDKDGHNYLEDILIKAETIEAIGGWLIYNQLYREDRVINLVPNPTVVTFNAIRNLYKAMHHFFSPLLENPVSFDQLLMADKVVGLFVSTNFYAPAKQEKTTDYTIIYLNSWGELFHEGVWSTRGFSTIEEIEQDILRKMKLKEMPLNTIFYSSEKDKMIY